jgi:hypothetical protein
MGNLQTGFNPAGGFGSASTFGKGFLSNPLQGEGGLSALLNKTKAPVDVGAVTSDAGFGSAQDLGADRFADSMINPGKSVIEKQSKNILGDLPKLVRDNLSKVGLGNNLVTGLLVGGLGAGALMGNMEPEEIQDMQRGEGLDIEGIRTEVIEAMKDPSGEALKAIRIKYPFLGTKESKDIANMAMGGRIGFNDGGGFSPNDLLLLKKFKFNPKEVSGYKDGGAELLKSLRTTYIPKSEGGIMDLGGMEKDYRNTGGFVDIGEYEKKDDVPARLSVNEFVMTADAVRGMGDGDIDLGAKRMENLMGAMENKKGAQQMFDVSERLSEVV